MMVYTTKPSFYANWKLKSQFHAGMKISAYISLLFILPKNLILSILSYGIFLTILNFFCKFFDFSDHLLVRKVVFAKFLFILCGLTSSSKLLKLSEGALWNFSSNL